MDKDLQRSQQSADTVRVHGVNEAIAEDSNKTSAPAEGRMSGKIRVEQLRRDQEASRRLREEAYEQRRLAQARQYSAA